MRVLLLVVLALSTMACGPDVIIKEITYCDAVLSAPWGVVSAFYEKTLFADDAVSIECSVDFSDVSAAGAGTYLPTQPGAESGSCFVTADIDTPSSGYWEFNHVTGNAANAIYKDPGGKYDKTVYALECEVYRRE
jgi:hypothetical protein